MIYKKSKLLLLGCCAVLVLIATGGFTSLVQNQKPPRGYYIVVAAYKATGEGYASRYASKLQGEGQATAEFVFFPEKNMYFVYLGRFEERAPSLEEMRRVRSAGIKEDAWVYVYKPNPSEEIVARAEIDNNQPATPIKAAPEEPVQELEDPEEVTEEEEVPTSPPIDNTEQQTDEPEDVMTDPEEPQEDEEPMTQEEQAPSAPPAPDPNEGKYLIFLNLQHGTTQDPVEGQVSMIDPQKSRVIRLVEGNQWNYVDPPSNAHNEVHLQADIFGYRKVDHTIDLEDPLRDSTDYFVDIRGDSIFVDFDMVEFRKGDLFTMYNVYFFSHSAIMRPESKFELDQLLAMLERNPTYKVRIHGHTNGNATDLMRYHDYQDTVFFSQSGAVEKSVSAKALSEERAQAVRSYLIHNGIDPERMDLKGWGGKRMLFKKNDPQAIKNVRVEVEIVEE